MILTRYKVSGLYWFRGHPPNSEFIGRLDPEDEQRYVNRANVTVLERIEISLIPEKLRPPKEQSFLPA
jgi:hypothetical protein